MPPNVSAEDPVITLNSEGEVWSDPDGNSPTLPVLATSNPDEWCECIDWDDDDQCTEWKYHHPDNPTNCQCDGAWGNCVWWALYTRRDIIGANWDEQNKEWDNWPKYWVTYAEETGYPVEDVPKFGAIAVFDTDPEHGIYERGHVAYVTKVLEDPPGPYSRFEVSEMHCGKNGVFENLDYYADGGNKIHFIYYKTEGTHLLMQLFPTEVWPLPPIYATDQLQFAIDIRNYGEVGVCPEFHFLFTSPLENEVRLRTDGCSHTFAPGQWAYALFNVHDWIPNCTEAGWWTLEQVSYRVPGDSRQFPLIPICTELGCVEQEVTFCVLAPEGSGVQGAPALSDEGCPSQYLYPTPTPTPTSTPTPTPTPAPPAYLVDGFVTGPAGPSEPIGGVTVCAGGYCVETDSAGNYRIEGLAAGTHTVTPSKGGYRFIPESKEVTGPPDLEQVNFVGVPDIPIYSISGFVTGPEGIQNPIPGVTVCISQHGCVTTDDSGQYRKEGLPPGAHTVTPSKQGYSFNPPDKQVTLPPDAEQVNFTGTPVDCCYHIAGYVTGPEGGANPYPGIRVDIRGKGSSYTDHNGRYIIAGLEANRYKVLPYDDRYDFGPVCKWVAVPPNREDVNFVAVPTNPSSGVTLYEHDQYRGIHETYTGDIADLTDSCIGDNVVTSLKIKGLYSAILYREPNYQGTSETLTSDDPQLSDNIIGNDTVSSVCILFGDFEGNRQVDVADIQRVASRWRMTDDDPDWDSRYDLNGDGVITVVDIMLVSAHWGETCP